MSSKTAIHAVKPASSTITSQAQSPVVQHEIDKQLPSALQQPVWQASAPEPVAPPTPPQQIASAHNFAKVSVLQTKLSVSSPGDIYEQEADQIADQVMRMPEPVVQGRPDDEDQGAQSETIQTKPLAAQITPLVQRQSIPEEEEEPEEKEMPQAKSSNRTTKLNRDNEAYIHSARGQGQQLSRTERDFFEPRFGHNFSSVRIHTDSRAANASRQIHAQAFTIGNDVFFGDNRYQPATSSGRLLLAHELTHVVQQHAGAPVKTRLKPAVETKSSKQETGILGTVQKNAPIIVRGASTLMDKIIFFLRQPTVLWLIKRVYREPEKLINSLEKKQKSALVLIEYAVNNPGKVMEYFKAALGKQIATAVEAKAKAYLAPVGKHFKGVWRHLEPKLLYLKKNWWPVLKEVGGSILWPIPNTIKDVKKISYYLGHAWDNLLKHNYRNGIEDVLSAWREGNALIGRYYGWIFLASIILGGIIGGVAGAFAGGAGAIPGALVGIKIGATVAASIGYALLISAIGAEVAIIIKSIDDLRVATTEEELEHEYEQIADSALALGIMGAFVVLGALASRFARAIVSRARGAIRALAKRLKIAKPKAPKAGGVHQVTGTSSGPKVEPYGTMKGKLPKGVQRNHLNQNAAYRSIIPENEGSSVAMRGNAFSEPGTPHYKFHKSLESFWEPYRPGKPNFGKRPTNAEYSKALNKALQDSGFTADEAAALETAARNNRAAHGILESDPVPRIPGKLGQKKPP